jgi:surface protein
MYAMFTHASSFNQPLDQWCLDNVTNTSGMFYNALAFNQPLNSWNMENVETLYLMFTGACSFNQPLDNWNLQKIAVEDLNGLFDGASAFNQPLTVWKQYFPAFAFEYEEDDDDEDEIRNYDESLRCDVGSSLPIFDICLSRYHISVELRHWIKRYSFTPLTNETISEAVEQWCRNPTEKLLQYWWDGRLPRVSLRFGVIESWDTSQVTDMSYLFYDEHECFNENIEAWDVSNVTSMKGMFYNAQRFNQPLNGWDVSKVTDMSEMFVGAHQFNQPGSLGCF